MENYVAESQAAHEQWLQEKILTGWVYGPFELADIKEHPLIVPYSMLPAAHKKETT